MAKYISGRKAYGQVKQYAVREFEKKYPIGKATK